jgi:hypothetical protein
MTNRKNVFDGTGPLKDIHSDIHCNVIACESREDCCIYGNNTANGYYSRQQQ